MPNGSRSKSTPTNRVNRGLSWLACPTSLIKESEDRVSSALANCGFAPLRTRTTINLAPGDLRKQGPLYDLPIALALAVVATPSAPRGQPGRLSDRRGTQPVRRNPPHPGRPRHRPGLPVDWAKQGLLLPGMSAEEAALRVEGIAVYRVDSASKRPSVFCGANSTFSPSVRRPSSRAGLRRLGRISLKSRANEASAARSKLPSAAATTS